MNISIDMEFITAAYKKGFEDAFMILNETPDLDNTLNCNNITTSEDDE